MHCFRSVILKVGSMDCFQKPLGDLSLGLKDEYEVIEQKVNFTLRGVKKSKQTTTKNNLEHGIFGGTQFLD